MSRSYKIHGPRKKHRLRCGSIKRRWRFLSFGILIAYEKAFERLGFFLARRPWIVLLVSLIVVFASCLGFIRLRFEQTSVERFTATNSQSRKDLHHAAQFFPLLEARQEQIILVPKHGQNILSGDCLKEAILVHQTIVNISGYSEICSRQLPTDIQQKPSKHDCIISSPLELAGTQFEDLKNFSTILAREFLRPTVVLSSGQTFISSHKRMLSNFRVRHKTDPPTARANALRVIYFIREPTNEDKTNIIHFETYFESLLSSIGPGLRCASLFFKTQKSKTDALQSILRPEVKPLSLSALAMAVLVFVVLYISSDNPSSLTTVPLMMLSILFPMTCSAGIISMTNTSLFPTFLFIPFLLLGKSTSDVVLLLVEWERQKATTSLKHRVSCCVNRAGFLVVLSALCGAILSGIAIYSSFDVISDFFKAALVTLVLVSAASFTITVILLTHFEKRAKKRNTSSAGSCKRISSITSAGSFHHGLVQRLNGELQHIFRKLTLLITSLGGNVLSLFILACLVSLCVLSALQPSERTNNTELLYQDDNFQQFREALQTHFGNEADTSVIFSEKIDYSKETVQNQIIEICTKLEKASYREGKLLCWTAALRQWALDQNMTCSNSEFYRCLKRFLRDSQNFSFRQELRFGNKNHQIKILASRIQLKMKIQNQLRKDRGSLEQLRKDLLKQSPLKTVPACETFVDIDDVLLLEREAIFIVFISATGVVFVFSLISNAHLGISILLAVTFDFLVLEASAIMETFAIYLNHISFLSLFITIVISLQVVYEAIEDAGLRLYDLQKCRTGVFVGVMNLDYAALMSDPSNYKGMDQFSSTGSTLSIIANRVSFCLNLTGPSLVVDTACSSSLTALKIACDNLHNGECEIAIVCAPNVILNHAMQMTSSLGGLLAPDGRSKSFDASGDGYGRGEGFAAVILKMSHAAANDKDDEYCEILACGMNSDGQNAVPMAAPSSKMQAELSRRVLEQSGVNSEDVDFFEAHGTGTAIGDVVEVNSIAETYTRRTTKSTQKLRIGSVKSNLNHTESTSGLAGLIKVALMIKEKKYVPTVNINVLNPKLKLEENEFVVQLTTEPWITEKGKPRIAALNSFGFGGSNVHVILREVPSKQCSREMGVNRLNSVLTLSGRSREALQKMARLYSNWINENKEDMDEPFVVNLCYSLNERRSQFPHRLALAFGSPGEASKSLADFADDSFGWDKLLSYAEVNSNDGKLVFMFGGQGSQWYAMGRQLIESEAVFREAVLMVSNILKDLGVTWSLIEELVAPEDISRIAENCIAQPATFAVQYATAQLLKSWKIHPSAVIGHSLGEFAAACVAGIVTLEEAVQLVLTRSTLQAGCPNNGGMAALGMSEEEARTLLLNLKLTATLEIAAVNDAKSVTVSGESQSIETLGQYLTTHAKDTFWRVLGTKHAFHSAHMEPIKAPFQASMKHIKLKPQLSKIPVYSTVEGDVLSGQKFNGEYWWRNLRCPVQFCQAIKHVLKDGYKHIIEISTQPILAHYVKQIALQENLDKKEIPVVVATLPRKRVPIKDQHRCFLQNTVCKLYTMGFPIDWSCLQKGPSARFVRSVNSPWLENSFWYRENSLQPIVPPFGADRTTKQQAHPFLGQVKMTEPYSGLHCWETEIDLHRFPTLKDHAFIQGGAVMPGAAYLEMAFAMARDKFVDVACMELTDVKLAKLLTLPETQVIEII